MMNNYFGTTETSDPSFHLELFDNLFIGNLIITKRLTNQLIDKLIDHKEKCILHLTCTGMGGTKLEPLVPTKETNFEKLSLLLSKGFPLEQVVLRIDPIIPTTKGVKTAMSVIEYFCNKIKIPRIRVSFMDMYNHVKERLKVNGVKIPYNTFTAPQNMIDDAMLQLIHKKVLYGFNLETCAEELDNKWLDKVDMCGCVSQKDVDILGIQDKVELIGIGEEKQRKGCMCPNNKKSILKVKPQQCGHKCLYCFWKSDDKKI